MNKAIWLLAIPALLIAAFYAFWVPLPDTPARDTAGEMISVERDGRRLCYYVSGKGPPVILLASAGREVSDFNELVTTLNRAGYRTIAIEAPGIGNTPLPKGEPGLFDLADDVKVIARKELAAGEKAAIIGHAFGNRVARAFASKYDGDVNGVILIASGGAKPIPPKALAALKAIFDPRRTVKSRKKDIAYGFFASGNPIPAHWLVGWHGKTAIMQGKASAKQPYDQWHASGSAPMLVIQGDSDTIAPPNDAGKPLAREFPDRVKLVMIKDAGHALLPEQPAAIGEAVVRFLGALPRAVGDGE